MNAQLAEEETQTGDGPRGRLAIALGEGPGEGNDAGEGGRVWLGLVSWTLFSGGRVVWAASNGPEGKEEVVVLHEGLVQGSQCPQR